MVDFLKKAITRKEEDLLCPVCLEIALTPIFTCPDSHIICSACVPKLKVQECPQCRVVLAQPLKRHRFAEKTAVELEELLQAMKKLTSIGTHQDQEPHVKDIGQVGLELAKPIQRVLRGSSLTIRKICVVNVYV